MYGTTAVVVGWHMAIFVILSCNFLASSDFQPTVHAMSIITSIIKNWDQWIWKIWTILLKQNDVTNSGQHVLTLSKQIVKKNQIFDIYKSKNSNEINKHVYPVKFRDSFFFWELSSQKINWMKLLLSWLWFRLPIDTLFST